MAKRPPIEEMLALIMASLAGSRIGYTTTIGNAAGTTFTDASLIGAGANSFLSMSAVIAPDSILTIDRAEITAFNSVTGEVTLDTAYKGGQIAVGTQYAIITTGADLGPLTDLIEAIKVVTDALLVESEASWTLTTDGNVQDLYINNAPAGVFIPRVLKVDFTDHLAGDTVVIHCYERIRAGGGWIEWDTMTYAGLVSPELVYIDLKPNRHGLWVTMQSTVGAFHDYDCEIMMGV